MLVDLSGVDYLGWGAKEVAGYIGTAAGRDLNAAGLAGLRSACPSRSRSASP